MPRPETRPRRPCRAPASGELPMYLRHAQSPGTHTLGPVQDANGLPCYLRELTREALRWPWHFPFWRPNSRCGQHRASCSSLGAGAAAPPGRADRVLPARTSIAPQAQHAQQLAISLHAQLASLGAPHHTIYFQCGGLGAFTYYMKMINMIQADVNSLQVLITAVERQFRLRR